MGIKALQECPLDVCMSTIFLAAQGIESREDDLHLVYTVKVGSSLYILHAFMKKSKRGIRTPKRQIDLIRRRLRRAREMEAEEEVTDE